VTGLTGASDRSDWCVPYVGFALPRVNCLTCVSLDRVVAGLLLAVLELFCLGL
jgi:hypothetical protein